MKRDAGTDNLSGGPSRRQFRPGYYDRNPNPFALTPSRNVASPSSLASSWHCFWHK
jgi:hypothetical protein